MMRTAVHTPTLSHPIPKHTNAVMPKPRACPRPCVRLPEAYEKDTTVETNPNLPYPEHAPRDQGLDQKILRPGRPPADNIVRLLGEIQTEGGVVC